MLRSKEEILQDIKNWCPESWNIQETPDGLFLIKVFDKCLFIEVSITRLGIKSVLKELSYPRKITPITTHHSLARLLLDYWESKEGEELTDETPNN